jgi:hypothetical protein
LFWQNALLAADDQACVELRDTAICRSFWWDALFCHLCDALRDAEVGLSCWWDALVCHLLWQDALLWLLARFAMMTCVALRDAVDGMTCGALKHAAVCQSLWPDALLFHLLWLAGFAMMACGTLRRAEDNLIGHGGLEQFTVLWDAIDAPEQLGGIAVLACSTLRHCKDAVITS